MYAEKRSEGSQVRLSCGVAFRGSSSKSRRCVAGSSRQMVAHDRFRDQKKKERLRVSDEVGNGRVRARTDTDKQP